MRHTFCLNLVPLGADLKEVKDMIGIGIYHRLMGIHDQLHKRNKQELLAAHYARNGKI